MVESIVVIANMNSKSNLLDKSKVKKMDKIVGSRGKVIRTHNLEDLMRAIHYILKYQPEVTFPDGGDGMQLTYDTHFIQEFEKEQKRNPEIVEPLRAIPPSGTWNVLAKHVGNKSGTSLEYLQYIMGTPRDDLTTRDSGLIKTTDDKDMVTYGFSFGIGMPITLLKEAYKAKYMKATRVAQVIGHLLGSAAIKGEYYKKFAEKRRYKITNGDNGDKEVELLGLMAQTVPAIGLPWSNIFYKAIDSDKFHVLGTGHDILELAALSPVLYFGKLDLLKKDLLFRELDVRSVFALLPILYNTELLNPDNLLNKQMTYCEIESEGEPFPYTISGDLDFMGDEFKANKVTLEHGGRLNAIKHVR